MDIAKMILLVISLTILFLEFVESGKSTYIEYRLIVIRIFPIYLMISVKPINQFIYLQKLTL